MSNDQLQKNSLLVGEGETYLADLTVSIHPAYAVDELDDLDELDVFWRYHAC